MSEKENIYKLTELFENEFSAIPEIKKIMGGGSPREYYRLSNANISVIGVVSNDKIENEIFIRLDKMLANSKINVPAIIKASKDSSAFLQQDLGDKSLFSLLNSEERIELSKQALKSLIKIQTLPEADWVNIVGFEPFSERLVRWDLNYFKYDYLKPAGIVFDENKLEDDFDKIVKNLTSSSILTGFMYRDFQSRNIMVKDNTLWFIDFQGARKGPITYDAVSFIWQAKAPFSIEEREALGNFYVRELGKYLGVEEKHLNDQMNDMMILRTLQVLGAYGFRGLIERKPHFLDSISYAIKNLNYLRGKRLLAPFPEIERISKVLQEKVSSEPRTKEQDSLTLSVYSFSYKKGYPEDLSGNGGGFIFDCRAIHNPGRYEEYKSKTGRDHEVITFLERTSESGDFINRAVKIVTPSIETYIKRGFTSLQVGFGCTGGQHRSVYCAEKFAKQMAGLFPEIKVFVNHKEQFISYNL